MSGERITTNPATLIGLGLLDLEAEPDPVVVGVVPDRAGDLDKAAPVLPQHKNEHLRMVLNNMVRDMLLCIVIDYNAIISATDELPLDTDIS